MAVVKGPAMSIAASGNLGPICYSRWRELAIARDVWTGTVPNTPDQQTYQGILITMAQAWGGVLTEEDREAWRAAARVITFQDRFGEPVHYSGYILFVSRNMVRRRWISGFLFKPEQDKGLMIWYDMVLQYASATSRFEWRHFNIPTGKRPDILEAWQAGPYNSPGRVALEKEYRYYNFKTPGVGTIFKVMSSDNKWYWLKMRMGDFSGVVSPFQTRQVFAG
ncbi:hypothetical protein ES703_69162 [subsurface metagenome]